MNRRILRVALVYGVVHAGVDASCSALVFWAASTGRVDSMTSLIAVVVYNALAFAAQPLVGWGIRRPDSGRKAAVAGALMCAAALPIALSGPVSWWLALVVAGVGNALFHTGAGVVTLLLRRGSATAPGVFVAPGAAGLTAGIALGAAASTVWIPATITAAAVLALLVVSDAFGPDDVGDLTAQPRGVALSPTSAASGLSLLALVPLLAVVVLRSYVAGGAAMPWKADSLSLLWALTAAVVLGKGCGGLLADHFGRARVGVGSLLASLPLLLVAADRPLLGILGMFLFNMTMPITLVALADLVPERPGFAFGLTCLALFVGALPALMRLSPPMSAAMLTAAIAGSAALLCLAFGRPLATALAPFWMPAEQEEL